MKHQHQLSLKWGRTIAVAGLAITAFFTCSNQSSAQTPIAQWTFETSAPARTAAAGWYTNIVAEIGSGTASALHASASTVYSSPAGNGSAHSFSANFWGVGDFFQFSLATTGFTNITVSLDQTASNTGPGSHHLEYSLDGVTFTTFGSSYTISNDSWSSSGAPKTVSTHTFDLSSVPALANKPVVYFRVVDDSTVAVNLGVVATSGTCRIDNFTVLGTIAGPPQIVTQPTAMTVYYGDTVSFSVISGGDAPIYYQWYTNSTATALVDGSSGYGSGTISGSTSNQLVLSFVDTNQAGNYFVIVSNALNWVTSSVVHLTVNVRTPIVTNIAYLHTLYNTNYALTDTTNIYVVEGVVTTIGNLVSGTTEVESFFLQDSTGGMDCFFRGGFPFPSTGDRVRITAPLLQFQGLLEAAPVNGNPAHSIEILSSGNPVPAPQIFDFTTLPTAQAMEENIEGRYLVVSNVFLGTTNSATVLVGGQTIFMTNSTGQVFKMTVANNPALAPVGYPLAGTYATAVRGVMSQSSTSTVLTNNYSIVFSDNSQIDFATPPVLPIPLSFTSSAGSFTLNWADASFNLQMSTNVAGPYITISGAASPFTTNTTDNAQMFFRLQHP